MKGLFIPDITAEMFRNGCLEGIEALMAEGEIYDIDYSPWIPVSERLPKEDEFVLVTFGWFRSEDDLAVNIDHISNGEWMLSELVTAWMPLPKPYREDGE